MRQYTYDGPVLSGFGTLLMDKWKSKTYAISKPRAESNLKYQFKTKYNMPATSRIFLPGEIQEG